MTGALLLLPFMALSPQQTMLDGLRTALQDQDQQTLNHYFSRRYEAQEFFRVAYDGATLREWKVKVIPTPPGWDKEAGYWVVFHKRQDIEANHDPVYAVIETGEGLRIGAEISEAQVQASRIANSFAHVVLDIEGKSAKVQTRLDLKRDNVIDKALVFRINDNYALKAAKLGDQEASVEVATDKVIPAPEEGSVLQAGGLLIVWKQEPPTQATFDTLGNLNFPQDDHISNKVAYLTAWWVPSIGRLPHTSTVRIEGPKGWVLRSEGEEKLNQVEGDRQIAEYRCDLPISYPKVVAGKYVVAAERKVGNKVFRAFHFDMTDRARAEKDVALMAEGHAFLEKTLGAFPFPGYECFDAENYYGIESYSYTLLDKGITSRYVVHEMVHTYFGGLVPCPYVEDSWNEGLTTYVDDVLTGRHVDSPIDNGWRTVDLAFPLDRMAAAHAWNGSSYPRGAYVMKMLEAEIGAPKVLAALQELVKDRIGKNTRWKDLRPYFERSGGKNLKWFWEQWVHNGVFPMVAIASASPAMGGSSLTTEVLVVQSGTPTAFRLRFVVQLRKGSRIHEKLVEMDSPEAVFKIETPFVPESASINPLGYALVKVGGPVTVKPLPAPTAASAKASAREPSS